MFYGANSLSLDAKGRLAIPARYREELQARCGGRLMVTVNNIHSRSLWIYPYPRWQRVSANVAKLSDFNVHDALFKQTFLGYATEINMDKSGRILLTQALREFAALSGEVYLNGEGRRFALWDAEVWQGQLEAMRESTGNAENYSDGLKNLSL